MQKKTSILLILLLIINLISNGCTVIGYGVGYAVDKERAPYVQVEDISAIKPGDHIRVTMLDQTVIDAIVEEAGDKDLRLLYQDMDPKATTLSDWATGEPQWNTRTLNKNEIKQI